MGSAVVGFDIGSYSCYISIAKKGGIETVLNEYSDRCTPPCVSFTDRCRFIGSSANTQLICNPKNTINNFVPLVGKKFLDNFIQMELPFLHYKVIENKQSISVEVSYLKRIFQFRPEQLLAMAISKLKQIVENELKAIVNQVVVNVPIFYTDTERRCVLTALSIAGVECISLINDLTAVGLVYHATKLQSIQQPKVIVYIDIGYKNFQIAFIKHGRDSFQVLQTAFDGNLGGREFDRVIYKYLANHFAEKYSIDVLDSAKASIRLMLEAEKIKKRLSANSAEYVINIECLMNNKDVSAKFDRVLFESLCDNILTRMSSILHNVLKTYRQRFPDQIASVEFIGGTSRIPCVRQMVTDVFKQEPLTSLNADEAVSRGCAIQSAMLNSNCVIRHIEFTDVVPYGITLETYFNISLSDLVCCDPDRKERFRRDSIPIITSNESFPMVNSVELNQCSIIEVKYSDRNEVPNDNKIIGYIKINQESVTTEKMCKFLLEYSINGYGMFVITSLVLKRNSKSPKSDQTVDTQKSDVNKKKGKTQKSNQSNFDIYGPIDFQVDYLMATDDDAIIDMIKQEAEFIQKDTEEIERLNVKNKLEESVYKYRDIVLNSKNGFLSQKESEDFLKFLDEAERWLLEEGNDEQKEKFEEYFQKLEQLVASLHLVNSGNDNESNIFEELSKTVKTAEELLNSLNGQSQNSNDSVPVETQKLRHLFTLVTEVLREPEAFYGQEITIRQRLQDLQTQINIIKGINS